MPCDMCASETSEDHSDVPFVDEYFTVTLRDEEVPDGSLGKMEYEFCSVRCLLSLVNPLDDVSMEVPTEMFSVKTSADGPVLEVGDTEVLLRAFVEDYASDDGFSTSEDRVFTDRDDHGEGSYWMSYVEDDAEEGSMLRLELSPEIVEGMAND